MYNIWYILVLTCYTCTRVKVRTQIWAQGLHLVVGIIRTRVIVRTQVWVQVPDLVDIDVPE